MSAEGTEIIGRDTALRRLVDVVCAAALLAGLAPLLAVIAVAVRLDSPGPICYRALRVGRDGKTFRMLKFRSMQPDADRLGPGVSGRDDPRVTHMGRVLRSTKFDELPQLLNVLHGTMTLVGPRAEAPRYLLYYTAQERQLVMVRPGVTGPGQLDFTLRQAAELDGVGDPDRHYIEHQLHGKLALDLDYLRERRLRRDVEILATTIGLVVRTTMRLMARTTHVPTGEPPALLQ
jgi:lipopolysaccharide/colanic/teichoic acid biosynthesis glycosyltransferase